MPTTNASPISRALSSASEKPRLCASQARPSPAARPAIGPIQRDMPVRAAAPAAAGGRGGAGGGPRGWRHPAASPDWRRRRSGRRARARPKARTAMPAARPTGAARRGCDRRPGAGRRRCRQSTIAEAATVASAMARKRFTSVSQKALRTRRRPAQYTRPTCTATTPAVRFVYSTRSNPACSIIALSVCWSGCIRIDSAR